MFENFFEKSTSTYLAVNNIKPQNLVIFSFKIRMKHKFSLTINQI